MEVGQLEIGEELGAMKADDPFSGFHFHDELPPDHEVQSKIRWQPNSFVLHREQDLRLKLNVAQSKLDLQATLINRFKQAGPEVTMNLDRSPDDDSGQFILVPP